MPGRELSEQEFDAIRQRVLTMAPKGLSEQQFHEWAERMGRNLMVSEIAEAEQKPAPMESALSRVGGALRNAFTGMVDLASVPFSPFKAAQVGEAMYQGSADQARKAGESFRAGNYTEAAAHAVGTVPVVGTPLAQTGEQIGTGDLAGGLTNATMLLAPSSGAIVARGARRVVPRAVPAALERSATTGMEQALGATTRENKVRAARVAPEMARRGVVERTLPNLEARAASESAAAGQRVGEAVRQVADQKRDVLPIVEQLEQMKAPYVDSAGGRRVVLDEGPVQAVQKIQDTLMEYGDQVSLGSLNKVRQRLDEVVQRNKGFTADDVAQVKAWAAREARTVFRDELSQANPNIDAVMAEYAFWQNIEDMAHATNVRRTSQGRGLLPTIAGGAGAVAGELLVPGSGVVAKTGAAVIGARTAASLRRLFDSPGYQMWSAAKKRTLADALARRDLPTVETLVVRNLIAVQATTKGDTQRRQRLLGSLTPAPAR